MGSLAPVLPPCPAHMNRSPNGPHTNPPGGLLTLVLLVGVFKN